MVGLVVLIAELVLAAMVGLVVLVVELVLIVQDVCTSNHIQATDPTAYENKLC